MSKSCKNCGLTKKEHKTNPWIGMPGHCKKFEEEVCNLKPYFCEKCKSFDCICKKPQNHKKFEEKKSIFDRHMDKAVKNVSDKIKKELLKPKKPQKGCGEEFDNSTLKTFMRCGQKGILCPTCVKKPQNDSPQKKSDSSVGKTENLRSGLVSPNPEDTPSSDKQGEGTFNLSEKICRMTDYAHDKGFLINAFVEVEDIKTFIKKDWDLINDFVQARISYTELKEKRDKLAGEELSR